MTGVDSWSITPATNATADGGSVNWAEGQAPSTVNNTARQMIADLRAYLNDLIWFQYGTGDQGAGNIAVPAVYSSGTAFTITGADVTAAYHAGRRVRAVGSSTGTIYGSISSSSYNGGNTTTTVNVTWDSGSLSNETLVISLSQIPVTGSPLGKSGSLTLTGTLSVTGHVTFEGVTSTGATGTGKLVFQTSPLTQNLSNNGVLTTAADNVGGGAGPVVIAAGLVTSLANNGTSTILSAMVAGQCSYVQAFGLASSANNVKADCLYDGTTLTLANKVQNGAGIDLVVSGANVQVKNTTGVSASISWRTG